ncbi:MAG: hypothetical protein ACTSQK_10165 [Candidatus Heimdallarchaeota archaeon]
MFNNKDRDITNRWDNMKIGTKIKIMSGMTEKEISDGLKQIKFICKDYCGKYPSYQRTGETNLVLLLLSLQSL